MKTTSALTAVCILGLVQGCGGGGGDGGGPSSSTNPTTATASTNSMPTSSISGIVVDKNGNPIAGATITAFRTNDHIDFVKTTDASGRYSFTGLSGTFPYGAYEVRVDDAGYGFYATTADTTASVVKADYNALFRMIISVPSHGGYTITDANFVGMQSGERRISVPRTAQVTSYVSGDDAALAKGVARPTTRFIDNNDGTITDTLTGLIWLKDAGCFNVMNWTSALTAANQLASGSCGLSDASAAGQWRLPNIGELEGLVDISRSNPALASGHSFANVGTYYWSSTTYRGVPSDAWVIRFSDGRYINDSAGNYKATAMNGVWAVKNGSSTGVVALPATGQFIVYGAGDDADKLMGVRLTYPRFVDNGNGTVSDTVTGLTWLKRADCVRQTWDASIAQINSLANGQCGLSDGSNAGDWRMPNRSELLSLVDRAETNQALRFNTAFYKNDSTIDQPKLLTPYIENELYWTSSTDAADTTQAWTVHSCDYGVYNMLKSSMGYSLAVR